MEPTDLTIQILREIRDEIRDTRKDLGGRIDQTNARLDQTNARLDQTNVRLDRLETRQTESEIHLATELVALAGAVNQVRELLAERLDLKKQVDDHERRLLTLEQHPPQ